MIDAIKNILADPFWFSILWMAVLLLIILNGTAACILAERKIAAFVQDRKGPNRVGPWGILQPIADGLKFLLKEDIVPRHVDKPVFLLASGMAFGLSMLGFAIVPWAGQIHWPWMAEGQTVSTQVADINVGILYLLAVGSMGVYGVVLAGWASNNKYAFYGGMRATAQMMSYEVPLGLGILCVLLMAGDLRLGPIVQQQAQSGVWYVFMQPIAFLLVLTSAFAEANRAPFDLAEAEQELVGGYHTEYSALKFGLFFLGEYAHMITSSAILIALFFGGWAPLPIFSWIDTNPDGTVAQSWWNVSPLAGLIKFGIYFGKIVLFIGFYMLVRWTLPRFRFDQLMHLAWRGMVPVGIAAVMLTAMLAAFGLQRNLWANLGVNLVLIAVLLFGAARSRRPVTGRQPYLEASAGMLEHA